VLSTFSSTITPSIQTPPRAQYNPHVMLYHRVVFTCKAIIQQHHAGTTGSSQDPFPIQFPRCQESYSITLYAARAVFLCDLNLPDLTYTETSLCRTWVRVCLHVRLGRVVELLNVYICGGYRARLPKLMCMHAGARCRAYRSCCCLFACLLDVRMLCGTTGACFAGVYVNTYIRGAGERSLAPYW
jgi:hypothetical protein